METIVFFHVGGMVPDTLIVGAEFMVFVEGWGFEDLEAFGAHMSGNDVGFSSEDSGSDDGL